MTSVHLANETGIARLTLARPEVHNAFDDALIAELTTHLERLANESGVRALVLTGDGASFSAGADLNWMRRMAALDEAQNHDDARGLARLMRVLREFPAPTIARVNGSAFGGGVGLVACCDIAIAVDSARFGLTEVKLGLVPAAISPHVLDAIGPRQASRWFLTGELFDAATALRIGLVHEVTGAGQLDDAVAAILKPLRQAGPAATREAKTLLRRLAVSGTGADGVDEANAALIARLRVSQEGQEGLSAFLEKRKPGWS